MPPFSYDRDRAVLTTVAPSLPLTPPLSRREREQSEAVVFSVEGNVLVAQSANLAEAELAAITRRVFSMDLDLSAFAASLEGEPNLARSLA